MVWMRTKVLNLRRKVRIVARETNGLLLLNRNILIVNCQTRSNQKRNPKILSQLVQWFCKTKTQALLQKSRLKCKGRRLSTKKFLRLKKPKGIHRIKTKPFQSLSTTKSLKRLQALKVILVSREEVFNFRLRTLLRIRIRINPLKINLNVSASFATIKSCSPNLIVMRLLVSNSCLKTRYKTFSKTNLSLQAVANGQMQDQISGILTTY